MYSQQHLSRGWDLEIIYLRYAETVADLILYRK